MKSKTLLTVIAVCAITGVLAGVGVREIRDASPASGESTTSPTPRLTTAASSDELPALDDLVIRPGAVGPVTVGMSSSDALATGFIGPGPTDLPEGCILPLLTWKAPYANALDIQTLESGKVVSLGVSKNGPATSGGLGIGSTFAEVQAALGGSKPEKSGYGQAGLFEHDSDSSSWIGYLFGEPFGQVKADSKVTFIEVTHGDKPALIRDGC